MTRPHAMSRKPDTLRLRIEPAPTGDEPALTTWGEFLADNADVFTEDEADEARATLASGKPVLLHLGAGGVFTLHPFPNFTASNP